MAISISSKFAKLLNTLTPGAYKSKLGDIIVDLYKRIINPTAGRTITASTTLVLDDSRTVVRATSGSAIVLTIPSDLSAGWSGDKKAA